MSASDARERLQRAWDSLQGAWAGARDTWCDEVAERFEREFWTETEATVHDVLRRLADLEDAIARVP